MIWRCCTMIMNNGMNCGIWSMADLSTHEIVIFLELRFTIMWVPTYPSLWWRIVASEEKERWYSQGRDERRSRRFGPIFGRRKIFSSNYATDNFEQRVDDERWEEKTIHPLELGISHNQSAHGTKTSLLGRTPWDASEDDETLRRVMTTLVLFDERLVRVNVQSVGSRWKEDVLEWQ